MTHAIGTHGTASSPSRPVGGARYPLAPESAAQDRISIPPICVKPANSVASNGPTAPQRRAADEPQAERALAPRDPVVGILTEAELLAQMKHPSRVATYVGRGATLVGGAGALGGAVVKGMAVGGIAGPIGGVTAAAVGLLGGVFLVARNLYHGYANAEMLRLELVRVRDSLGQCIGNYSMSDVRSQKAAINRLEDVINKFGGGACKAIRDEIIEKLERHKDVFNQAEVMLQAHPDGVAIEAEARNLVTRHEQRPKQSLTEILAAMREFTNVCQQLQPGCHKAAKVYEGYLERLEERRQRASEREDMQRQVELFFASDHKPEEVEDEIDRVKKVEVEHTTYSELCVSYLAELHSALFVGQQVARIAQLGPRSDADHWCQEATKIVTEERVQAWKQKHQGYKFNLAQIDNFVRGLKEQLSEYEHNREKMERLRKELHQTQTDLARVVASRPVVRGSSADSSASSSEPPWGPISGPQAIENFRSGPQATKDSIITWLNHVDRQSALRILIESKDRPKLDKLISGPPTSGPAHLLNGDQRILLRDVIMNACNKQEVVARIQADASCVLGEWK